MSALGDFYLASTCDVTQLELFEITHPNMTQAYRFTPYALQGVTVDLSPDQTGVAFAYYPAEIEAQAARDDMDASISIQLGDLGSVMPDEVDAIEEAGGMLVKPTMNYWVFRSDQLDAPIYGPITFEVPTIGHDEVGSIISARAPRLNANRTGIIYTLSAYPMLRGYV